MSITVSSHKSCFSSFFEGVQKVALTPLAQKIYSIGVQILKCAVVAAVTYSMPIVSILVSLGLFFTCKYDYNDDYIPDETSRWMNHQYHLYDKVNLITLVSCNMLNIPVFLLASSLSILSWREDLARETGRTRH